MESNIPCWLNDDFIEEAIKSSNVDSTVKIDSYEVSSMASPGDHFMSNMYRATVHYQQDSETKNAAIVIKAIPESQQMLEFAVDGDVFNLELTMLRDLSPALNQILQELPFGKYESFSPTYLHFHDNPPVIVMEDLKKLGFLMLDRSLGLDYEHSSLVVKTLARFHAASVVLNKNNPHLLEKFKKSDPCLAFRSIIEVGSEVGLKNLEEEIGTWPGYKEKYCHKIRNIRGKAAVNWYEGRSRRNDEFNVLSHSDLWVNNMMFRYSQQTGDIESIRFVDYQFCYWTSPAVDLLYFLNSSTSVSITDKHEALIGEYHEELSKILTHFAIPHPSLNELMALLEKRSAIGLQVAFGFRSLVMADKHQMKEFIIEATPDAHVVLSQSFKDALLEESGIFEREIEVFSHVIPAMKDLLKAVYPKSQLFGAKYIYSTFKPEPTAIVLEDLKRKGFKLAEVDLGLDLKHSCLVMRTIARYHAASIVLHSKNPNCFDIFMADNEFAKLDTRFMEYFVGLTVRKFADEVDKWTGFKERYSKLLYILAENAAKSWPTDVKRNDAGFNVLAHGDLWLNNMMFKYSEEGEIQDIRFVDYQLSYWTSPAVDLHYFMNSSVSPDVLENGEILIKEYHHTLCETLSRLGYDSLKPTLDVLNYELENRCKFGVMSAIVIRTVALSDRSKVSDLNKIYDEEGGMNFSDRYNEAMKLLLPLYEKLGWLKS